MQMRLTLVLFVAAVVAGCSSKTTTTTTTAPTQEGRYSEDLSIWHPKEVPSDTVKNTALHVNTEKTPAVATEAKFAVNTQLDAVLDSISEVNLVNGHVDGFTIQVYSGTKREEALNAKKALQTSLPDLDSEVQYVQPNFRVRTGKYYDRFEAQKDYLSVKRHFPNAIVIPDRIAIN
jgi:hypothetical protein